jgi:hypothetical protein
MPEEATAAPSTEAEATPPKKAKVVSSEREFRQRLVRALRTFDRRELKALWHDPRLEPHMTLFVLLSASFALGILIWVVEPLLI